MFSTNSYQPKQFNLSGLNGISDKTLEMHFKLYQGYVKETNKLNEKIGEFVKDGKVDHDECSHHPSESIPISATLLFYDERSTDMSLSSLSQSDRKTLDDV